MFATATEKFAKEVDPNGFLIPVSSLNDTVDLLTVVVIKRSSWWFWQKPKYFPTVFHLSSLLTGDTTISPDTEESDFINFRAIHDNSIQGRIGASYFASVSASGSNKSKLQISFGSLKKEGANVEKLLKDSKGRVLDMSHCLIQQTGIKGQKFGIVTERIGTTAPCLLKEETQQAGECGGKASVRDPLGSEASLVGSVSGSIDSNVTMEIPTNTTIAFSLMTLQIEQDGSFKLWPMPDGPSLRSLVINCSCLRQDLEELNYHFQLLSSLPAATRSSLLQQLTTIMQDQKAISALQDVLEQMCQGGTPALPDVTITESQNQNIQAVLELVEQSGQVESAQVGRSTSVLKALDLISSALGEMTISCLDVLRMCCSSTMLQALEELLQVHILSGDGEFPVTAIKGDVYEKAEQMFASCNVSLKRDGDTVKTEIKREPEDLPLVLGIAIRGLASLGP